VLSGSGGRRPYFRQNARPIHGQGIVPKRLWHSLKPEHAWILLWSSAHDFHSTTKLLLTKASSSPTVVSYLLSCLLPIF
jgi:hypothetical protein